MNSPLISQFMGQRKRIFIPQQDIQECSKALQKAFIPFNTENTLEGVYFVLDTPHLYEEACAVLHSLNEELIKERMSSEKMDAIKNSLKFYKKFGPYSVYLVDDFLIRNTSVQHEEFSNYAIHDDFPNIVPKGQIWISKNETERERQFYILNALKRLSLMAKGMDTWDAYDKALKFEKEQRAKVDGIKKKPGYLSQHALKNPEKGKTNVPVEIYKKFLGDYQGYKVFIVDQELVQDLYKSNWVDGGNNSVYHWTPVNELWLSDALHKDEMKYVLWHEWIECNLMKDKGLTYDEAHALASKSEYQLRRRDGLTNLKTTRS